MDPASPGPRLRIGLIAPPCVAVPPPEYGGSELVVDHLARGLTASGHDVTLFTTGDSTCPVRRRWTHPAAVGTTGTTIEELRHVESAYDELRACDVIHDHSLLGPLWAVGNDVPVPVVTTVHGEFTPDLANYYRAVSRKVAIIAISHHQRSTAPDVPVDAVIHHGIDVHRIGLGAGDGGYVLFLGRMSPNKGVHRAIRIARSAGKRLLIAAKMWEPDEHRYYVEEIEPQLGTDVEYLGQVGGAAKEQLIGGAEALVNPIRWNEPFGLVMIEALAAGTPVLAFAEGAAPEIVDHGRTGFVCRDEADMVAHLAHITDIDRADCRASALHRFSTGRMVAEHLDLYRDLAARGVAGAVAHPRGATVGSFRGALEPA